MSKSHLCPWLYSAGEAWQSTVNKYPCGSPRLAGRREASTRVKRRVDALREDSQTLSSVLPFDPSVQWCLE